MPYTPVNPYITVEELVEELKGEMPADDSEEMDKYLRAIDRASRFVDGHLRETFFFRDYSTVPLILDQTSRGVYGDKIYLPFKPIIELTRLDVGLDTWTQDTDFVIGQGDDAGRIFSLRGNFNPRRPDNLVKIYATFGYPQLDETDAYSPAEVPQGLPLDIVTCVRLIAAVYSGDARKEFFGVDGENPTSISTTEIPKTVFTILGRRMPILT
jgi:hypothetical protein